MSNPNATAGAPRFPRGAGAAAFAWAAVGVLLGGVGCRTRLYDFDETSDFAIESELEFDGAVPPDLVVRRDNCGVYQIRTTEVVRADLLLVQDRSRSMGQGVNGGMNPAPGQSKWQLVRAAIEQVVSHTSSVDWGLMLFGAGGQCAAPTTPQVPVGPGTAATIKQVLDGAQLTQGTPTTAAVNHALAWFQTVEDQHPHYLLLATDGLPTCGPGARGDDSAAVIAAVASAAEAGVRTFVVGIGNNTGAEATLTRMAQAGRVPNTAAGQPAYYVVAGAQDLVNILEQAALRITPCSYPLAVEPPDPDHVVIQGTQGVVPRDPSHVDGWDYGDDGKSVVFFGPACDTLRTGMIASVETTYGCPGD